MRRLSKIIDHLFGLVTCLHVKNSEYRALWRFIYVLLLFTHCYRVILSSSYHMVDRYGCWMIIKKTFIHKIGRRDLEFDTKLLTVSCIWNRWGMCTVGTNTRLNMETDSIIESAVYSMWEYTKLKFSFPYISAGLKKEAGIYRYFIRNYFPYKFVFCWKGCEHFTEILS